MGIALLETIPYMAGGAMISSAIALNHRFGAKVSEPSRSLYGVLSFDSQSKWKSSFIAGMLFAASLVASLYGFEEIGESSLKPFESEKLFFKGTGMLQFMLSGFLIGLGTRLAQRGSTKFGFYGIPRLNGQSITASLIVFFFAVITATIRSSFSILHGLNITKKFNEHLDFRLSFLIPLLLLGFNLLRNFNNTRSIKEILTSFGIGNLLAAGMMAAGLGRRHQVLDFLSFNKHWNPFYIFVLLGALLTHMFLLRSLFPEEGQKSQVVHPRLESIRMLLGSSLFGVGLGISGLSPGTGLLVSPIYLPQIALFFLPFIAAGQMGVGFLDRLLMGSQKGVKTQ